MTAIRLLGILLIGGVKKFSDINHFDSFLSKSNLKNASYIQWLRCPAELDDPSIKISKEGLDLVLNIRLIPPSAGLRFKTDSTALRHTLIY
jgi:hypothetical protein